MQNFYNKRGDTFEPVLFTVSKSLDQGVTKTPIDLSSIVRIDLQIREKPGMPVVFEFSTLGDNPKIQISNAPEGKFTTVATIIDIPAKIYYYDIQIKFSETKVKTWVKGFFTITDDVTRVTI